MSGRLARPRVEVLFTSVPSLREEPPLNETDIKERVRQEEGGAALLCACVCHYRPVIVRFGPGSDFKCSSPGSVISCSRD